MTDNALIATAHARIAVLVDEGTPILWVEERTGNDALEAELNAALPPGWALVEDEDGDLVAVRI